MESSAPSTCPGCNTELGPGLLVCPACHRLIHQDRLRALADTASAAAAAGSLTAELTAWREALELLPAGSRQAEVITAKMVRLRERIDAGEADRPAPAADPGAAAGTPAAGGSGRAGVLSALGLLVWKFKFVLTFLLTKAKLLFLGFSNLGTVLSMFVWLQVYWHRWGWPLALGLMLCIYVHEMGHVAALTRYGMKASAPMFIPGFGALIRLSSRPVDPVEDARIGLAGPMWGLGAAVAAWLGWKLLDWPALGATARLAAWINLFNLIPVWQLDGGRGFNALSTAQRCGVVAACALTLLFTTDRMPLWIAFFAVFRILGGTAPARGAARPFGEFVFLVLALAGLEALSTIDPS